MNPRSLLGVFCALNILVYLDRGRKLVVYAGWLLVSRESTLTDIHENACIS